MSYRLEGKDIVISGFQDGIADSPYQGHGDLRNVNISSIPGEVDVNFSTDALTLPPIVNALAFTAANTGDLFTVASTTGWYDGMAIVLNTWSGTGPSTGVVYYLRVVSATTFQIYTNPFGAVNNISPVAVTGDGSGTLTSYQMAKPMDKCLGNGEFFSSTTNRETYIIDTKNQVWVIVPLVGISTWPAGKLLFCGNIGSTVVAGPSSIAVWNEYLLLFRVGATDIWDISNQSAPASRWSYAWNGVTSSSTTSIKSLVGQDNAVYICNGDAISSLLENANEVFDPTDSGTYTGNSDALSLPEGDTALCLAELGTNLLVGGSRNYVYPWDRVSTSYSYPIVVPERYIAQIVSTQSNAYIFAGNRGYIYVTNGANVDVFKKIPDHLSGVVQPYYTFGGNGGTSATAASGTTGSGDAMYWRNHLFFTFKSQKNDGTVLTTTTGVWAIDLETNALRLALKMSYNTYEGVIPVLCSIQAPLIVGGEGVYAGWVDGSSNWGIDSTVSDPYIAGETIIDMDMIPVGTYLDSFSPTQVEWKTSRALVSGETIQLLQRETLFGSFTSIGTSSTAGAFSGYFKANFEKKQWTQLRAVLTSTNTTPSYVPLTEVRIRDWPQE